jgi:hypothetical protein
MSNPWYDPIHNFFVFSIFIPFLTGLFCWKRIDSRFHVFIIYLGIGCVMEVLSTVLYHTNHYTRYTHHISVITFAYLEVMLVSRFFLSFTDQSIINKFQYYLTLTTIAVLILDYKLFGYHTYRRYLIDFFFGIILIFLSLRLLVNAPRFAELRPMQKSLKLITLPMLLYVVGFLFIVLLCFIEPVLKLKKGDIGYSRSIFVIFNFLGYILYSLALIWTPKRITFLPTYS